MKPEPLKGKLQKDNLNIGENELMFIENFFYLEDVKSAVQGLLIDIEVTDLDEIVCSDGSHRRMDEKTRKRIITDLIQKWFPNMVNKDV